MSQRETVAKPLVITSFAGVNDRLVSTELPPSEFSLVEGTFPGYSGLQERIYGKRLLAKYPNPIWGIFQFWTPVGYANGLYQFEGQLDSGPWKTPTSNIVIPTLPAELPFDGGGMTLDDFGNTYGGPIGSFNACSVAFGTGGSSHDVCGAPPSNVGLPDDNNGGPAGVGTSCAYEVSDNDADPDLFIVSADFANLPYSEVIFSIPGPQTVPLGPDPQATNFLPTTPPFTGYRIASKANGSYWIFSFGSGYQGHQGSQAQTGKLTFNFATLQDDREIFMVTMVITQHRVAPAGPDIIAEYPITLTRDADGVPVPVVINMEDYLDFSFAAQENVVEGFQKSAYATLDLLRIYSRVRICA